MKKSHLIGALCASVFIFLSTATSAALVDNGGGLIYDNVLDITWAQPDEVFRNFDASNTWAAGLTLGGVSGWRLPYISVAAGTGPFTGNFVQCRTATEVACRDNEPGYMFYQNLNGTFFQPILGSGDPDLALFPTLRSDLYYSSQMDSSGNAFSYSFANGFPGSGNPLGGKFSWAVHAGNVGAVPVPAAVWLFGSGLIGLLGAAKRKR